MRKGIIDNKGLSRLEIIIAITALGALLAIGYTKISKQKSEDTRVSAQSGLERARVAAHNYLGQHNNSYEGISLDALRALDPKIPANLTTETATPGSAADPEALYLSLQPDGLLMCAASTGKYSYCIKDQLTPTRATYYGKAEGPISEAIKATGPGGSW